MSGAIPPLPQYAFMVWCSVKARTNLLCWIRSTFPCFCFEVTLEAVLHSYVLSRSKAKQSKAKRSEARYGWYMRHVLNITDGRIRILFSCWKSYTSSFWRMYTHVWNLTVRSSGKQLHSEELHNLYTSPNSIWIIGQKIRRTCSTSEVVEMRSTYKNISGKPRYLGLYEMIY